LQLQYHLTKTLKRARSRLQFLQGSAPAEPTHRIRYLARQRPTLDQINGVGEKDKIEELLVAERPTLRGLRYGGNIRLSMMSKLANCEALQVHVDGQRFTLYPGSDMEMRAAATARMEVEPIARSTASIDPVLCTFYGKP